MACHSSWATSLMWTVCTWMNTCWSASQSQQPQRIQTHAPPGPQRSPSVRGLLMNVPLWPKFWSMAIPPWTSLILSDPSFQNLYQVVVPILTHSSWVYVEGSNFSKTQEKNFKGKMSLPFPILFFPSLEQHNILQFCELWTGSQWFWLPSQVGNLSNLININFISQI